MNDIQIFAFIVVPLIALALGWGLTWYELRDSRRVAGEFGAT